MVWRNLARSGQPSVRVFGAAARDVPSEVLTTAHLFSYKQWRTSKAISTTSREALQRQYKSAHERVSGVQAPLAAPLHLQDFLGSRAAAVSLTPRLWACSWSVRAQDSKD